MHVSIRPLDTEVVIAKNKNHRYFLYLTSKKAFSLVDIRSNISSLDFE